MQEQASNRLKLLWSKAMVVSVKEKSRHRIVAGVGQGVECKRTTDEVSKRYRRRHGVLSMFQDKPRGNLFTAWVASGIKVART